MNKYFINKKMTKSQKKSAIINAIDCAYEAGASGEVNVFFLTKEYFISSKDGNKVELYYSTPTVRISYEMVMAFNRKYNYLTDIAEIISAYIG